VILFLNPPEVEKVEGVEEFIAEEKRKPGQLSKGERNTLIAFGVAITLGRPCPGWWACSLATTPTSCTRA
jgi:hypothetical protein